MNRTSPDLRIAGAALLLALLGGCAQMERLGIGRGAPPPPLPSQPEVTPTPEQSAALSGLRTATLGTPDDPALLIALAEAAEGAGQIREAMAAADRAVTIAAPTPARLLVQGRLALRVGDAAKSAAAFRAALEAEPNRIEALTGLGVALDLLGQPAEAQDHLRRALAQRPRDWGMRGNLAFSLINADDPAGALALLEEAERDARAPQRARHNLAMALVGTGDRERAIRILRTDMGPTEAESLTLEFDRYLEQARRRRTAAR
jgi:Flp pilus assembly protein TadD